MSQQVVVGATLKVDSDQAVQNVGSFRKQLQGAKQDLVDATAKFGPLSEQAQAAAKHAGELYGQLQDIKKTMQAFNPEQKFAVFSQSIRGAVGGFEALQGAIALTGVKSEEVEKALLKVQAAMALSQGLNEVQEAFKGFQRLGGVIQQSTLFVKANELANKAAGIAMKLFGVSVETTSTSFKVLKGAIAATGIGLIVLAISEAVSWFNELTNSAQEAEEAEKSALELKEKYNKIGLEGNEAEAKRQFDLDTAKAKAAGATEEEIFQIKQNYTKKLYALTVGAYNEAVQTGQDTTELNEKLKNLANQGYVDAYDNKAAHDKKMLDEQKAAEKKKEAEDKAAVLKEKQHQKELAEARGELRGSNLGKDLGPSEEDIQTQKDLAKEKDALDLSVKNVDDSVSKKIAAQVLLSDNEERQSKRRDETAQAEAAAKITAAESVGEVLGELSELAGQQTTAGKALALAQIAIDEAVAISGAIRQASANPLNLTGFGFIADMAARIAAIVGGVVKAKSILSGANTSAGSVAPISNIGTGVNTQAPVKPQLRNQSTQLQDIRDQINKNGNAAIKAYVVTTDINKDQEKVQRIQRAARLG